MIPGRVKALTASKPVLVETASSLPVATLFKWLVPSVSALFVVVGYVIHWAYQDFLGVVVSTADSTSYAANAASFLRDVLTTGVDALRRLLPGEHISFAGYGPDLAIGITLLLVALWPFKRLPQPVAMYLPAWSDTARVAVVAVLLVSGKFVLFDLPISRIESVLVGVGPPLLDKAGQEVNSIDYRLTNNSGAAASEAKNSWISGPHVASVVKGRSISLWQTMVCSRLDEQSLPDQTMKCAVNGEAAKLRLPDTFAAYTFAAIMVLMIAVRMLQVHAPSAKIAGILILMSFLTWPYAYGKLLKSTTFEYGAVQLATALPMDDQIAEASDGKQGSNASKELPALILGRHAGGINLLIVRKRPCTTGGNYNAVKVWTVAASQVQAIKEIYTEDAISWRIRNSTSCPAAREFGTSYKKS